MTHQASQPTISPPFLVGEKIYLRALLPADVEGPYPGWFNDREVCRGNSHHVFPSTVESAKRYIQHANQTRENLILAIVSKQGDRHLGNIALQHIHPVYHSAEFSIVIGEKDVWGQGIAKEAGRLICDHGFLALNLYRIACGTFENNIGMQRLALYLGMIQEGVRRQAAYKEGKYLDLIEYGVLKHEYLDRWSRTERKG
jgi:RimJ/RimL family protein N-acetyltransferase